MTPNAIEPQELEKARPAGLRWLDLAALVVGPAILFYPALFLGRVVFWGTPMLQFVPWRQFALDTLRGGHLPLWNPLVGLGAPLLANYQSALFYPPNWIQAAIGVVTGQSWLIVLHLVWCGLGLYLLARRIGLGELAGLVAGMAFSLSTYIVARSGFLSINASVAWLPWVIIGVDRLAAAPAAGWLRSGDRWAYPWTIGALALQWLAGHAQISWYTFLLAVAWMIWRARNVGTPSGVRKAGVRLGVSAAAAFGLAAPQLLPTLSYLAISQRASSVGRELAMTYSFWPWHLLGLVTPDIFGSPVAGDYWGYGNYWEDAIYVGVLPLCLALAAAWRAVRGKGPLVGLGRLLAGLGGVSIVLALGWNTPLYPLLYDWVPTFSLFQAPARWTLWLVFALALLAGMGVDAWRPARGGALYWLRLGTAGGVAVTLGAGLAALSLRDIHSTFIQAVALAGLWLVLAGVLALLRRQEPGWKWSCAVILVAGLDLVVAGWGLNPFAGPELYQTHIDPNALSAGGGRIYMAPEVEYGYKYETVFRFDSFQPQFDFSEVRKFGLANANMLDGVASVNNFDPILPYRYDTVLTALPGLPAETQSRWLAAMNVSLASTTTNAQGRPVFKTLSGGQTAWFVDQVRFAAGEVEALQQSLADGFDPIHTAVIEGLSETLAPLKPGRGSVESLASDDPNQIGLATHSSTGGWVVVSATYAPGWSASTEGSLTQVYPADGMLMAIWVPAGDHTVWFEYTSRPLLVGVLLALLGLVAGGALWKWA